MSEPHIIKQGDTEPALTVILVDGNGDPISLSGDVTVRIRAAAPPYTVLLDGVPAIVDPDQVANTGRVTYEWQAGDTDLPGDYLAEWYVDAFDQTFPTSDYNRITITDSLVGTDWPTPPLVSLGDIETAMGRSMTPAESARALQLIDQVADTLSLWLNRDLVPQRHTETHRILPPGRLIPYHGPVREVESISVDGAAANADWNTEWDTIAWPVGSLVEITYTSGGDPRPAVAAVIIDAVAGATLAGPQVATGAIASYSVEGTSITYGTAAGGGGAGAVGKVPVASLRGIGRLRRRVLR